MIEYCETVGHYQNPKYCILMDELVEPLDNCGMYDNGEKK